MPFKSQSQMRKFRAMEAAGELPKGTADRWASHTPDMRSLPERVDEKEDDVNDSEKEGSLCVLAIWAHGIKESMQQLREEATALAKGALQAPDATVPILEHSPGMLGRQETWEPYAKSASVNSGSIGVGLAGLLKRRPAEKPASDLKQTAGLTDEEAAYYKSAYTISCAVDAMLDTVPFENQAEYLIIKAGLATGVGLSSSIALAYPDLDEPDIAKVAETVMEHAEALKTAKEAMDKAVGSLVDTGKDIDESFTKFAAAVHQAVESGEISDSMGVTLISYAMS